MISYLHSIATMASRFNTIYECDGQTQTHKLRSSMHCTAKMHADELLQIWPMTSPDFTVSQVIGHVWHQSVTGQRLSLQAHTTLSTTNFLCDNHTDKQYARQFDMYE